MSVVFSAIASHSPLLIPQIGKENIVKCQQTVAAYQKLADSLKQADPDTIVVFSPHGLVLPEAFSVNMSAEFEINFAEFGDWSDKLKISGDLELASRLKQALEAKAQLQAMSESVLDSGSAVPLFLLAKACPQAKILPLYPAQLSLAEHFNFGQLLRKELANSSKKIAIIASADLSHCLTRQAPAGYSPKAKKFDKKVLKALEDNQSQEILNLDPQLIEEVNESGLRPMVMLLGVLSETNKTAKLLSYEYPFGVGCLVVNYLF